MDKPKFRGWQMFTRYDIPDNYGRPYLTRWRLIQTPWFGIYLHKIHRPDHDRHLHDHPWSFLSIVLRGGYLEARPARERDNSPTDRRHVRRGPLSFAYRRATDLHSIIELHRYPTWTLLFVGRKTRKWGFKTDNGWVPYHVYFNHAEPQVSTP